MAREGVSIDVLGIKEINEMFMKLPKKLDQDKIWAKFWRKTSIPLVKAAKSGVKDSGVDRPYFRDKKQTIKSGTLKKSIKFFRTRKSKELHGGYVGPKVFKGSKASKGGFYGAWVEYGNEVMLYGKFRGKSNPFMKKAWNSKKDVVVANGMKDAEIIFARAMKSYEKRMQKYGSLGF